MVQLYARSSQLDTAYTRFLRFGNEAPLCPFGCGVLDTIHHVFVECPTFHHMRHDATASLVTHTRTILNNAGAPLLIIAHYCSLGRALFRDSQQWPLHRSRFYFGVLPKLPHINAITPTRARDQVVHRIANVWHSEAIRLAGRIWGDYKRRLRPVTDLQVGRRQKPVVLPRFLAHVCDV
ncbi:hypothetical protein BDZ89DRAFT_959528 [Hymenopellis radicata]|nr:hypothetical protein BDZ89DRAFT_959528 [Hymenopellis radicata]